MSVWTYYCPGKISGVLPLRRSKIFPRSIIFPVHDRVNCSQVFNILIKKLKDFFLVVEILFNIVTGLYLLTHPYKSPVTIKSSGLFYSLLKPLRGAPFRNSYFIWCATLFFISPFACFRSFLPKEKKRRLLRSFAIFPKIFTRWAGWIMTVKD